MIICGWASARQLGRFPRTDLERLISQAKKIKFQVIDFCLPACKAARDSNDYNDKQASSPGGPGGGGGDGAQHGFASVTRKTRSTSIRGSIRALHYGTKQYVLPVQPWKWVGPDLRPRNQLDGKVVPKLADDYTY